MASRGRGPPPGTLGRGVPCPRPPHPVWAVLRGGTCVRGPVPSAGLSRAKGGAAGAVSSDSGCSHSCMWNLVVFVRLSVLLNKWGDLRARRFYFLKLILALLG